MSPEQRAIVSVLLSVDIFVVSDGCMVRALIGQDVMKCSKDQEISASNVFKQMWDQNVLSESAVVLLLHYSSTLMFLILKTLDILIEPDL